jgi:phosphatidate cytidylyltransferase
MLKQRIITASILAILVIWAVLKLPVAGFGVVLLAVILPGAWEWARLASLSKIRDRILYVGGVLAVILMVWPFLGNAVFVNSLLILSVGWVGVCVALDATLRHTSRAPGSTTIGRYRWYGGADCALGSIYGVAQRVWPGYVLFLFLLVWAADVGAYFAGRRWGQHKLAHAISPGQDLGRSSWRQRRDIDPGLIGRGAAGRKCALANVRGGVPDHCRFFHRRRFVREHDQAPVWGEG